MNELYQHFLNSSGITTDSRNVKPDSIFFSLRGDSFNGNLFANEALEKGALLAIVDEPELSGIRGCIYVQNAYNTLLELAAFHRKQLKCPVIAITGSNGKTTTKELIVSVLSTTYNVSYTQGNLNNHIGVPLTILAASEETEILVVEMGANHRGDIRFLCDIAQPDYGLITNIGKAHLEGFGSPEAVFLAKTELFENIIQNGKGIFLYADDDKLAHAAAAKTLISYGLNQGRLTGKIVGNIPFLQMEWSFDGRTFKQDTHLIGAYNAANVLAAAATGVHFNVKPEAIISSIASYIPQNNRSQLLQTGKNNQIVLDAYNANPSSMHLALDEFSRMPGKPKVAILGEMMELGAYSDDEHLAVLDRLKMYDFDIVFLVGQSFFKYEKLFTDFQFFSNTEDLCTYLNTQNSISNSYIIIKGSRSNALERVTEFL